MKFNRNIIPAFATAIFILLLKWQFMESGLAAWLWLLKPAVFIFQLFTNISLSFDPDLGFISHHLGFVIDKSCAALNFWLILISLSSFYILKRREKNNLLAWSISLAASYPILILINGFRLIFVYYIFISLGPSSLLHMIFSLMIFFTFLLIYTQLILHILKGKPHAQNYAY